MRAGVKGLPLAGLGLKEVAAVVCSALAKGGHAPVLVGNACAAIYAGGKAACRSVEFAVSNYAEGAVERAMASAGFSSREQHIFASRACPYEVVLIPGPASVGDHLAGAPRTFKTSRGPLKLLTPTDCVRQRLSMFYRWGDRTALGEAVRVARRQVVDMEFVGRWSEWEWATDRFKEFCKAVGERR